MTSLWCRTLSLAVITAMDYKSSLNAWWRWGEVHDACRRRDWIPAVWMEAGERQIKGLRQSAVLHTAAASGIHFNPVMERGHQQIVESDEAGFSRPTVNALAPRWRFELLVTTGLTALTPGFNISWLAAVSVVCQWLVPVRSMSVMSLVCLCFCVSSIRSWSWPT